MRTRWRRWRNAKTAQTMPRAMHRPADRTSGIDPALHGLGGVGRRGVEADRGVRRQLMDEVEHLLEQQQALLRFAQARADHDAVEALVAHRGSDAGFRGRVEIDQAARDLVTEITQA